MIDRLFQVRDAWFSCLSYLSPIEMLHSRLICRATALTGSSSDGSFAQLVVRHLRFILQRNVYSLGELDVFALFEDRPPGSVVLSGSLVVMAMLGLDNSAWSSQPDIDIFVTSEHAPHIRTKLVQQRCVFRQPHGYVHDFSKPAPEYNISQGVYGAVTIFVPNSINWVLFMSAFFSSFFRWTY